MTELKSSYIPACDGRNDMEAQRDFIREQSTYVCERNSVFSGVMRPSLQAYWMHTVWELVFPVKPRTFLETQTGVTKTHAHTPLTQQTNSFPNLRKTI